MPHSHTGRATAVEPPQQPSRTENASLSPSRTENASLSPSSLCCLPLSLLHVLLKP
ncbi:uncharacterized protein DS421_20g687430 [Arachis hypogaea]|nr:uncharacterized protein DS421_20g687430 [Arachis hypogaea]